MINTIHNIRDSVAVKISLWIMAGDICMLALLWYILTQSK